MDKFIVKRSRLDIEDKEVELSQNELAKLVISQADESSTAAATVSCVTVLDSPVSGELADERDANAASVSGRRVTRPFKRDWLAKYPWLIYDETNDKAFCITC